MCNAWNHPPECTCGWGGDGYSGAGGGFTARECTEYRKEAFVSYRQESSDFCHKTDCPRCGGPVFFIRHNDGSVWVDELGWPWPKHGCFEDDISVGVYRSLLEVLSRFAGNHSKPALGRIIKCIHGYCNKTYIYLVNTIESRVAVFATSNMDKVLVGLVSIEHLGGKSFVLVDTNGRRAQVANLDCGADMMRGYLRKPAV
jgi:hypothetical protein